MIRRKYFILLGKGLMIYAETFDFMYIKATVICAYAGHDGAYFFFFIPIRRGFGASSATR